VAEPRQCLDVEQIGEADLATVAGRVGTAVRGTHLPQDRQRERAASLDPQIEALLQAQCMDVGSGLYGAFAPVEPVDDQDIDFATRYFNPLRLLAQGYALPASAHFRSAAVAEAIAAGLIFTRRHVYPGCPRPGNWWVWGKQMPDTLSDLLALLHGDWAPADEAYVVSVLDDLLGRGPLAGSGYHTGKAGKDALNFLKVGALTGDRQRLAHAWECMENEVGPHLLEEDGTPLMTVVRSEFLGISLPYVYEGYQTVVEWALLTRGTNLALRPETTGRVARYLLDLGRWNTFRGVEVGWISFVGYRVFWDPASTLPLAGRLSEAGVTESRALADMGAGRDAPPTGCRYWPQAETLIFRTGDHYAALIMASQPRHPISWAYKNHFLRIGNRWHYGRDGHLVLAREPRELSPDLTYTLDWQRLTGVTRDDGSVLESAQMEGQGQGDDYWQPRWARCRNPLAGAAVVDGQDATAAIEAASGETRARKSYFFLTGEEAIVTLGSHIRGRGPTESIVHTLPVADGDVALLVNGERQALERGSRRAVPTPCWLHVGGRGYYFPDDGAVTLLRERRAPDFSDAGNVGGATRAAVGAQDFVSLLFDHGQDPVDAEYACVYFLSARPEEMPERVRGFDAAARYGRRPAGHFLRWGGFAGEAFYEAGELDGTRADGACFLARHERAGGAPRLAVFDPRWIEGALQVGLPARGGWPGADLELDVRAGCPLELDVPGSPRH